MISVNQTQKKNKLQSYELFSVNDIVYPILNSDHYIVCQKPLPILIQDKETKTTLQV